LTKKSLTLGVEDLDWARSKSFFDVYRQRIWITGKIFQSVSIKHCGKKRLVARTCYQPYKWIIISATDCHHGNLRHSCHIKSLLLTPRTGGIFAVLWARINAFSPR
jgi:hypothetical protein